MLGAEGEPHPGGGGEPWERGPHPRELLEIMWNILDILDLQGPARFEQLKCCQGDSGAGLSFAVHLVNVWLWPLHPPGRKRCSCSRKEAAWNPRPFLAV